MPRVSTPLWDRLCAKIQFPADPNDCFVWTGAKSTKRRGQLRPVISEGRRGSRTLNVARLVCEYANGPAPSRAHEAGHTCPNRERDCCVNPRHLRWMTRTENEHHKRTYRP